MNDQDPDRESKKTLHERLKGMSAKELIGFQSTVTTVKTVINYSGIGLIFAVFWYESLLIGIPCFILVYVLSHIGVGVDIALAEVKEFIDKLPASDK